MIWNPSCRCLIQESTLAAILWVVTEIVNNWAMNQEPNFCQHSSKLTLNICQYILIHKLISRCDYALFCCIYIAKLKKCPYALILLDILYFISNFFILKGTWKTWTSKKSIFDRIQFCTLSNIRQPKLLSCQDTLIKVHIRIARVTSMGNARTKYLSQRFAGWKQKVKQTEMLWW